jgi:hypothetical protein
METEKLQIKIRNPISLEDEREVQGDRKVTAQGNER